MIDVDGYLARIGARRGEPTVATLRHLQERHLATVPFENLSIHIGERIELAPDLLVDKVVRRHRGGFCYELNGAFAALLTALGYRVTLLSAQVYGPDGEPGVPLAHMALRVDLAEHWLVDVGFGRFSGLPLRLAERGPQADPNGTFHLVEADGGLLDVYCDDRPEYRLDPRPYRLRDFAPTCWYQQTSPDSHFTRSLTCSLPTATGRVTLSGTTLITTLITPVGTERTERALTDAEALATYRDVFGITLDRVPTVDGRG
ncbi:MAG TPA: arylamine N-acetyltransferase [Pseudonocardiaceae bacterium]|nr:arylamine N-acetyltransferase [Pseudonocardiaceae bacterium]